jgi:hypothetical protein
VSSQSVIWSRVPSAAPPPATCRQRPDCGFTRRLCRLQRHSWAPVPLQSHSWTGVPVAVAPPLTSIHLLSARSVPSPLFQAQLCASVPLQVKIWIAGAVVRAPAGVLDALAGGAEDRTGPAILRLDDGRRVEVVTGVDRLGETQVLALCPVERSGAAGRPADRVAGKVGTVPNLLRHEVAVIGGALSRRTALRMDDASERKPWEAGVWGFRSRASLVRVTACTATRRFFGGALEWKL